MGLGGGALLEALGLRHNMVVSFLHAALLIAVLAILTFRLATFPLITHFGDLDGETHGSARFTTFKELRELTGENPGLMIGRHPETKKILRYDGPAHLLTMAPTRSGKCVGSILPNLLTADRSVICIVPKARTPRLPGALAKASDRSMFSTPSA
ncbi:Agrobacterium virulence virD4-like protein (fragment) (plasmid) [Pseudorhizobium banfieldiae]|uniref:Agrobacterium virulence virD4-like protein n=1 Tax=Pseudorhizobium banfieldiae TaxID=1125847 RepID=L0NMV1_9HYPH